MENYCIACGKWRSIAASWMCGECLAHWADNDSAKIMIVTAEGPRPREQCLRPVDLPGMGCTFPVTE